MFFINVFAVLEVFISKMSMPCGCPTDVPAWDGQDIDLSGKHVHILPIPMFMHMPIAYGLYLIANDSLSKTGA